MNRLLVQLSSYPFHVDLARFDQFGGWEMASPFFDVDPDFCSHAPRWDDIVICIFPFDDLP